MSNFYKLNKDYIKAFEQRVLNRYKGNDKRSETTLFKAILEEVTELFRKLGGLVSSKSLIPASTDYPDSTVYNKILDNIDFDLTKLFNAQKLIESDINNLLNFNSNQRIKTFESLTTAQQEVYSAYVKSKRDVMGGVEVPEGNPFTSADNMSTESEDVFIDENRTTLTLACESLDNREIDVKNTMIYFAGKLPTRPIYPLGSTMGVGSHWKKYSTDPHYINTDDISSITTHKSMMVDDPENNVGVGYSEFEAVRTFPFPYNINGKLQPRSIVDLRKYIGKRYGKDSELIYTDIVNSLQGQYVSTNALIEQPSDTGYKYKLVVPLLAKTLTNEILVDFSANAAGFYPKINWCESKVFSRINGSDVAYGLVSPQGKCLDDVAPEDGKYTCHIMNFIYPSRLELIIEYDHDPLQWIPIDFYMSYYIYTDQQSYKMPYYDSDSKIGIVVRKNYDIFVDSEKNNIKEKNRALNVLKSYNRSNR